MAGYYAGTSGLVLPVSNKTLYPPDFQDKSRLAYYASLFNSIEINSSFYKVPQAKTIAKWASEVPDGFRFTYKLWRDITHNKGLEFKPEDVSRFMQVIDGTGDKKGCLLVQFPPSIKVNLLPQFIDLIGYIREADPANSWQTAIELRHSSWYRDDVLELITDNKMAVVLQDIPASVTPVHYAVADFVYLRLHGPGGKYRGSYSDDVLQEYSSYIREWQDDGKTVYVYFNNTMGDAVTNLATLNDMVHSH